MTKHIKTWWGLRFIEALETFTDPSRLQRGRSYAGERRILSFSIQKNVISAKVLGNRNPYFGVYEAPEYNVKITFKKIPQENWSKIIQNITARTGFNY